VPANNYITLIEKTMRVLEVFDGSQELTLSKIAKVTKLVKSSTFRILFTLQKLGYLEKTPRGHYMLTERLHRICNDRREWARLVGYGTPLLEQLVRRFKETVNLGVLDECEVTYLHVIESPHALRLTVQAGLRSPVHSTALGKCLLFRFSRSEVDKILKQRPLRPVTDRTIRDRVTFYRELEKVASRGYAIDNEEDSRGVRCIAAPVLDAAARIIAAISISGPVTRLCPSRDRELADELIKSCNRLSTALGYNTGGAVVAKPGGSR
jgi:DNA-binding IclR family transcriptional regulator